MARITSDTKPINAGSEFRCGTLASWAEEASNEQVDKEPSQNSLENSFAPSF